MKQKTYKQNERYFTEGEGIKILGAVLIILAVGIFFWGRGYIAYLLMCAAAPAGIVLFFVGASRRSTDADLDQHIDLATEGIEVALEENRVYAKRIDKALAPMTVGGYLYEGDVLLAKAKNGMIRSSIYQRSILYPLKDALYISARHISLVADEKDSFTREIPFECVADISILSEDMQAAYQKKTFSIKDTKLCITLTDKTVLSLPIKDDLMVEEFIEHIQRNIKKQKASEA